jgi:hypothetical protein
VHGGISPFGEWRALFPASRQLAALHLIVCPALVFRKGILFRSGRQGA